MALRKQVPSLASLYRYRSRFAAASIFTALVLASAGTRAEGHPTTDNPITNNENPQSAQSESRRSDKGPNSHIIRLDNTKGTHTLVLRDKFVSPQCISGVGANFSSLPPGSVGEIHVTEQQGILSGCGGMFDDKHVTLQIVATRTGTPALSYHIQFGIEDSPEIHGKVEIAERNVRILSSDFGKPGTPYKATCGRLQCLNEWALDYGDKSAVIYFYRDGAPGSRNADISRFPTS
ncbi:hypothetical protein [Trinickia diaoshuihuensis]|jgi:hypothetical protein|uniref:hypothetical protein n=1 Tax=Trinickia diaoshuihuensis TaxID=2292265 RepID=UPI000E278C74|nr:hypothetical protein [Trinickia diaoshuihuensis]